MVHKQSGLVIQRYHASRPSPRGRLICFPHAGVGAAAFREIHRFLPDTVDVCSVRLPGRESRILEPALTSVVEIADLLLRELQSELDIPYALVGQCLGAFVAFEFAAQLMLRNIGRPEYVFLLGQSAPTDTKGIDNETFDEFLDSALGGVIPDRTERGSIELIELMKPTIHADYTAANGYCVDSAIQIEAPLSVFLGDQDKEIQPEGMLHWRYRTNKNFTLRLIPGAHILTGTSLEAIARHIIQDWLDAPKA
jgi:medium-chain acyl-[acyl-carrier-protein] hydrolase